MPDEEKSLLEYATSEGWRYQGSKLDAALKYVRKFDVAVDVGAHCGLWSKELVKAFGLVVAFEPIAEHIECFHKNVQGNYQLHSFALGEQDGEVRIRLKPHKSGCTYISPEGGRKASLKRLDDVYSGPCDLLKIDTEGYEELVLRGAIELLKHKPVVIVEQKRDNAVKYGLKKQGAVELLESLGARRRELLSGDHIMSWDE